MSARDASHVAPYEQAVQHSEDRKNKSSSLAWHLILMPVWIHGIFASILQMDEFHGVSPEEPTKENTL
jgi:hypothetical protein